MDVFQRLGGVEAEVVLGPGKCLCDGVQHGGRADPGQRLSAFLVEDVAAILKELVDEKGKGGVQMSLSGQPHDQRLHPLHRVVL